jgi:uncharacterized protein (DUF1810 family)
MSATLQRFKAAQDQPGSGFIAALAEVRSVGKRGHWIWYVFPQLAGLGSSPVSRVYALKSEAEATAFLRDPQLRSRLGTITTAIAEQLRSRPGASLQALMGSDVDARKLVSSLTLFGHVAKALHAADPEANYGSIAMLADEVLAVAVSEGYPPCAFTLQRLGGVRQ